MGVPAKAGLLVSVNGAPWRSYTWLCTNIWMEQSNGQLGTWIWSLGQRSGSQQGWSWEGGMAQGEGAEGREQRAGRGAVVLTAACVSMEPSLSLGHTITRMQLTRITAPRLDVWSPQGEGTSLPSVPTPQTPPSSLPGPDEGRPPRQSSRRAPCPHTGHAGTGPRRGQV